MIEVSNELDTTMFLLVAIYLLISLFVAYDHPKYCACLESKSLLLYFRAPLLMQNSQFLSPGILMLKKNLRQHLHLTHCITRVSACISNDTLGLKVLAWIMLG